MNTYRIYKALSEDQFCFGYMDKFSDDATDTLIAVQDARTGAERKTKKKISFLVTECFQNVVRHAENIKKENRFDKLFAVRNIDDRHCIATVNPILLEKQEKLEKSIRSIQNLSPEDLKKVYLDTLVHKGYSEKGGAGLGLIEMARKSKQPLAYDFKVMNDVTSQFTLQVNLNAPNDTTSNIPIDKTMELYDLLRKEQILLLQKGNFSQESVLSLFELFENNLGNKTTGGFKSRSLYLLIELLQNMSVNSYERDGKKDGIFMITIDKENGYGFHTGNYVSKKNCEELKVHLKELQGLDKDELGEHYKAEVGLGTDVKETRKVGGIGLIEIFKLAAGNLHYTFFPTENEDLQFISFSTYLPK